MFYKPIQFYQHNPILRRLTNKLQQMNYQFFDGALTIQEPMGDSLFWHDEYIFGIQCGGRDFLGDKISAKILLENEENMIPELVKALTPWFIKTRKECILLEARFDRHKRREMYIINGVVKTVALSDWCQEKKCTCPGREKDEQSDTIGRSTTPRLSRRDNLRD